MVPVAAAPLPEVSAPAAVESEAPSPAAVESEAPSPEPVGASTQPVAVATAAPVAEAPSQYRPYPGSDAPRGLDKKISSASFAPTKKDDADEGVALSTKASTEAAIRADDIAGSNRPAMAPSLKKRGQTKKRGFFKRLFGIK